LFIDFIPPCQTYEQEQTYFTKRIWQSLIVIEEKHQVTEIV